MFADFDLIGIIKSIKKSIYTLISMHNFQKEKNQGLIELTDLYSF